MYLEKQVEELTSQVEKLKEEIEYLKSVKDDVWVSAGELAKRMGVSANTIYVKIRKGDIYATRICGSPRIPMSQFYKKEKVDKEQPQKVIDMKKKIFG